LSGTEKKVHSKNTYAGLPDEHLVSASQRDDTQAFEMLVLRYQRQIFNLIYQMTHDVEVVEDIGQDVFIAAFRAIKDFKAKSSFFTWLYRIAINHCKNYLASSNRSQDAEKRYFKRQQTTVELPESQEQDPQTILLAKEFIEKMEEALHSIPEEQQIVLTLCEFQGLSYQEIAEVLECPIGTVRSRLSRARTALQDKLGDYL
jgi:RNA polymerase sigma-70 factor (ECF subfamily)